MTSPGPGDVDNPVPALGDLPEQRGRRGAAARPLNRRNGRGRTGSDTPGSEAGEGAAPKNPGEPRPEGGRNRRPATEGGEPRPRREGAEPRGEGSGERREGRGGRNRRGGRGPAGEGGAPSWAPTPAGS